MGEARFRQNVARSSSSKARLSIDEARSSMADAHSRQDEPRSATGEAHSVREFVEDGRQCRFPMRRRLAKHFAPSIKIEARIVRPFGPGRIFVGPDWDELLDGKRDPARAQSID